MESALLIHVTDNRNLADFSIHYTNVRSYAGCRKQYRLHGSVILA